MKQELFKKKKKNTVFCPKIRLAREFSLNLGQFEQISVSYAGFTKTSLLAPVLEQTGMTNEKHAQV